MTPPIGGVHIIVSETGMLKGYRVGASELDALLMP